MVVLDVGFIIHQLEVKVSVFKKVPEMVKVIFLMLLVIG